MKVGVTIFCSVTPGDFFVRSGAGFYIGSEGDSSIMEPSHPRHSELSPPEGYNEWGKQELRDFLTAHPEIRYTRPQLPHGWVKGCEAKARKIIDKYYEKRRKGTEFETAPQVPAPEPEPGPDLEPAPAPEPEPEPEPFETQESRHGLRLLVWNRKRSPM